MGEKLLPQIMNMMQQRELSELSTEVLQEHKTKIIELYDEAAFNYAINKPIDFFVVAYEQPLSKEGLDINHIKTRIEGLPKLKKLDSIGDADYFDRAEEHDIFYGEIHAFRDDPNCFLTFLAEKYTNSPYDVKNKTFRVGLRVVTNSKLSLAHEPFQVSTG